jgi:hypothetical protein
LPELRVVLTGGHDTQVLLLWALIGRQACDVLLTAGVEASIRAGRDALPGLRRGPPDA